MIAVRQHRFAVVRHCAHRVVPAFGADEMRDRARQRTLHPSGAFVQLPDALRMPALQLAFEKVPEQIVKAQDRDRIVGSRHEQVAAIQSLEQSARLRISRHGGARVGTELREHGTVQHELPHVMRQLGQDLLSQIGEQMPVGGFVHERRRAWRARPGRLQCDGEPGGPAMHAAPHTLNDPNIGRGAKPRGRQLRRLGFSELQIPRNEFRELAMRPPARERQRRLDPRREHHCNVIRQSLDQRLEQLEYGRRGNAVQVVEHEHQPADRDRAERIHETGQRGSRSGVGAGRVREESRRRSFPRERQRFDRTQQRREEAMSIIVVVIDRDPYVGRIFGRAARQLRKERSLAVSARCANQGQWVIGDRSRQPLEQQRTRNRVATHARRPKFRERCGVPCRGEL